jgi:hypothetical protein
MSTPICVTCQVAFRIETTGIAAELMVADVSYQLWSADKWECPSCHFKILSGFGMQPFSEHFQAHYALALEQESQHGLVRYWGSVEDRQSGLAAMEVANAN